MKRSRVLITALGAVCAAAVALPAGSAAAPATAAEFAAAIDGPPVDDHPLDGGDPSAPTIRQQAYQPVYQGKPGEIAGNALVDAFDTVDANGHASRSVLMSWQANEDVPGADSARTKVLSGDRGYTFPSGHTEGISGYYNRLPNGDVLGVEFIPVRVLDEHRVELRQVRSRDGGQTWNDETAVLTTDKTFDSERFDRGLRVQGELLIDPQGNLLLTYYTTYAEDSAGSSEVAISRDNGRSWERLSTVFPADGNRTFNETGVSWATNGALVAVARSHAGSALSEMYTVRSADNGRTWSAAEPLELSTAAGEPAPTTGVVPVLDLLPNGIMTLTFGRPDNWVAISPDGLGNSFEQAQVTYRNHPDTDTGSFQRTHGSSGNGGHAVVDAHRILQVGDNCAPTWGCPATDSGFQIDNKYRVWTKFIDILGPGVGRIDLRSKYESGAVTIETNMSASDPRSPETGPAAVIDGSTAVASSAVRRGGDGTGTLTLTLDRTYTLTKAGLSLHRGLPSSAVVEVSTDGEQWTEVADTGSLTSYALTYFPIDEVPARYVRITVDDPNQLQGRRAMLNEIELYSTVNSFENDAVDYVPRGYTDAIGVTVTDVNTNGDDHALRLADAWNDKVAQATWHSDPAPRQDLSLDLMSMGYPRTLQFITLGTTTDGADVQAYQVAMMSNGRLGYYDATARKWNQITDESQAIPQKEWHSVRVSANLTEAVVYLDGEQVATIPPTTPGLASLTGHKFTSSGTGSTYDNFVIDNVEQTNPH